MCMLPDRYPESLACVMSLKGQVDKIYLCLNGFQEVPEALKEDWMEVVYIGENIGAVGRYTKLPMVEGDLISCDDDLVYPPSYVQDFSKESKQTPMKVLTHHGKYITNRRFTMAAHCLKRNEKRDMVQILGAGVSFFPHATTYLLSEVMSMPQNPTDIHVSALCYREGIGMRLVPHTADYFKYIPPPKGTTIWDTETSLPSFSSLVKKVCDGYNVDLYE